MVASRLYEVRNKEQTLDLFHRGVVCFGDAHYCHNGERALKMPLDWVIEKGAKVEDGLYLSHAFDAEKRDSHRQQGIQYKQVREGYFLPKAEGWFLLNQDFHLKSAYDSEKRKAKYSQMFGYYSLPAGSVWQFEVFDVTGNYAEIIKTNLDGTKRIGKSKNAEFGLAEIKCIAVNECPANIQTLALGIHLLYAASNLIFYDSHGFSTSKPTINQLLGLSSDVSVEGQLVWGKSSVKTRNYQTWNQHRQVKDFDKLIIEKGSVFTIKLDETVTFNDSMRIGSHLSEGFGEIILNPDFLKAKKNSTQPDLHLSKIELKVNTYLVKTEHKDASKIALVLNMLSRRQAQTKLENKVDRFVNEFISKEGSKFKGRVSSSQWGSIRSYAKGMPNKTAFHDMVFDENNGYLYKGVAEEKWRGLREVLKDFVKNKFSEKTTEEQEYLSFFEKLANEMAKEKS